MFQALEIIERKGLKNRFIFHIAGHGELLDEYKSKAAKLDLNIAFYGWIESDMYMKLLNMSDAYIHASYEEPFGIPPLDAMARGKVVIVSDGVKSTENLIKDGENGYIYPAYDAEALAERIVKLLTADLEKIGKQGYQDVRNQYSIQHNVDAVNSCFNE